MRMGAAPRAARFGRRAGHEEEALGRAHANAAERRFDSAEDAKRLGVVPIVQDRLQHIALDQGPGARGNVIQSCRIISTEHFARGRRAAITSLKGAW